MDQQIKVVVERDGKVRLEVEGVRGAQCLSLTAFLEKDMGEVCERRRTAAFYQSRQVVLRNSITNGNMVA